MTGDVGEGFLHDAVGGAAHRDRHVGPLTVDRQRRVQAGHPGPSHQFREFVEPGCGGGAVGAQCLQGRAQFPGRLTAGLADGRERLRHRLAAPAGQVHGDLCLHLDDRYLVGEGIVQFPSDVQPLLVGARRAVSSRVRSASSARRSACRSASPAAPARLEGVTGPRQGLADGQSRRQSQGRERKSDKHRDPRGDRDRAVPRAYGRVDREQERDGGHLDTGRLVAHRAHPGDDQHRDRCPSTRDQGQAAGHQPGVAEKVLPGGGRVADSAAISSTAVTPTAIVQSLTAARLRTRPHRSPMGAP